MHRIWTTVVSLWAVLAIVAVLAWSRPATVTAQPQSTPTVLVVKGKNGSRQLVVLRQPAAATHATTQTSPPPG
jgi:hypothetical protein